MERQLQPLVAHARSLWDQGVLVCFVDVLPRDARARAPRSQSERQTADATLASAALMVGRAEVLFEAADQDRRLAALYRDQAASYSARAEVDDLTGAFRRQPGFTAMQHEIDRCRRGDGLMAIGFVDVDGLKSVNDTHGHLVGDELLRAVVAALTASLRTYDVVVRFGGDEFVYSLAGCPLDAAPARFLQVQERLAETHPGASVSAGFAGLRDGDTVETMISRADADLIVNRTASAKASRSRTDPGPWPGTQGLSVTVTTENGSAVITVGGDLDVASAPQLAQVLAGLLGDGFSEIVLDLTALELMDATAIELVASALPMIKDHGGRVTLRSPRPMVRRVLDLSDVHSLVSAQTQTEPLDYGLVEE